MRFDYLDFSTAEKRRQALETELRLNRRTAPGLYRAVRPITRDVEGQLSIDGAGEPVDWLLEMERFPDDARLDRVAARGALDEPMLVGLADRLAAFHAAAPDKAGISGAARLREIIDGNAESLAAFGAHFPADARRDLIAAQHGLVDRHAALLDARAARGRLRHVHGDLHLSNIALIDGVPTPFDCLEFDARLATIDVLYDLAFLLMDLWQRGLQREANIVFNRYFDVAGEDEAAVALMPLFLSVRATIRAHVLAALAERQGGGQDAAGRAAGHFRLARDLLAPVAPRLVVVGGLSGTGKSTLARAIGGEFAPAPGARILRSDVIRKQLAGVAIEQRLPVAGYTPAASERVYTAIARRARLLLEGGAPVIADAVYGRRRERETIEAETRSAGARFDGIWLEADLEERVARVEDRSGDASDADAEVAAAQTRIAVGDLGGWRRLSAEGSASDLARRALALLEPAG